VTEEGTVATAATAVIMRARGAAHPPVIPLFRADPTFPFLIRDTQTGVILFFGRLAQPK